MSKNNADKLPTSQSGIWAQLKSEFIAYKGLLDSGMRPHSKEDLLQEPFREPVGRIWKLVSDLAEIASNSDYISNKSFDILEPEKIIFSLLLREDFDPAKAASFLSRCMGNNKVDASRKAQQERAHVAAYMARARSNKRRNGDDVGEEVSLTRSEVGEREEIKMQTLHSASRLGNALYAALSQEQDVKSVQIFRDWCAVNLARYNGEGASKERYDVAIAVRYELTPETVRKRVERVLARVVEKMGEAKVDIAGGVQGVQVLRSLMEEDIINVLQIADCAIEKVRGKALAAQNARDATIREAESNAPAIKMKRPVRISSGDQVTKGPHSQMVADVNTETAERGRNY